MVSNISQFCEGVVEAWADSQSSFDIVGVFSCVIKDLTDRVKQSLTDNEPSIHLFRFVEVIPRMFAGGSARSGCRNRCAGR